MMKKSHGSWSSILGFLCNINPLPPPRQESPLSPCPTVLSSLSMAIAYCSKHNFYQRQCLLHEVYSDLLQVPVNFSLSLDPLHWGVTCVFHSLHSAEVMILAFFLRPSHATHIPSLNPRLHFLIWPTHSWCPIFKNWIVKKKKKQTPPNPSTSCKYSPTKNNWYKQNGHLGTVPSVFRVGLLH